MAAGAVAGAHGGWGCGCGGHFFFLM
jgi:hypothetical protein